MFFHLFCIKLYIFTDHCEGFDRKLGIPEIMMTKSSQRDKLDNSLALTGLFLKDYDCRLQTSVALDRVWESSVAGESVASANRTLFEACVYLSLQSSLNSWHLTLEQVESGPHAASRCGQHLYCSSCTRGGSYWRSGCVTWTSTVIQPCSTTQKLALAQQC